MVAFEDAVFFEELDEDLRHAALLEDSRIDAMGEVGQARHQFEVVASQSPTGIALGDSGDLAMDARVACGQTEEGAAMEQRFEWPVRSFADQFELEAIGLADGLGAVEGENLEVVRDAFQRQGERRGLGRARHRIASLRIESSILISKGKPVQAPIAPF
ncbi:hypothetical protein J2W58_002099 [Pseudomonas psychrotolerans]|nr:hypothetical protein [Pseudomonas psychrotolerans]